MKEIPFRDLNVITIEVRAWSECKLF